MLRTSDSFTTHGAIRNRLICRYTSTAAFKWNGGRSADREIRDPFISDIHAHGDAS